MFTPSDEDTVIRIWLEASRKAHRFVASGFWEERETVMRKKYLPQAEIWVYEDDLTGKAVGFAALSGSCLAAFFVEPGCQGQGIGSRLMEKIKKKHREIELAVYKENPKAVAFYRRQGFLVTGEDLEPETGHPELKMKYNS